VGTLLQDATTIERATSRPIPKYQNKLEMPRNLFFLMLDFLGHGRPFSSVCLASATDITHMIHDLILDLTHGSDGL
jgi:hypothetical protein